VVRRQRATAESGEEITANVATSQSVPLRLLLAIRPECWRCAAKP